MKIYRLCALVSSALALGAASAAHGADRGDLEPFVNPSPVPYKENFDLLSSLSLDFSPPVSPALVAVRAAGDIVQRTSAPVDISPQLLLGTDPRGIFQTGVAIDFNPYFLFYPGGTASRYNLGLEKGPDGLDPTGWEIVGGAVLRFLKRAQVSAAATKSASDGERSLKLASALRLTFWDYADPYSDQSYRTCLRNLTNEKTERLEQERLLLSEAGAPPSILAVVDGQLETERNVIAGNCANAAGLDNWNGSSISGGLAPTWLSTSGEIDEMRWNSMSYWLTAAYGFEGFGSVPGLRWLRTRSQMVATVRGAANEKIIAPSAFDVRVVTDDDFFEQDALDVGLLLRFAAFPTVLEKVPDLVLELEGSYLYAEQEFFGNPSGGGGGTPSGPSGSTDKSWQVVFNADYRVLRNTYLRISLGTTIDREVGDEDFDQTFVQATVRAQF